MVNRLRGVSALVVVSGAFLFLGAHSAMAQKGRKISLGDAPSMKKGSPDLVLVEVSDFQCPYCGQGARNVLPLVSQKFVDTGKVELVYLNLPLQRHPHAFKAAEAAACAGDQKAFWPMSHLLFDHQDALAPAELPQYAEELGLDVAAFQKCLSSGQHGAGIRKEIRLAESLGITGTPAYLLGRRLPDSDKIQILEIVKGLPPYEELDQAITALLPSK
jgi:protein-disulfide isomerase